MTLKFVIPDVHKLNTLKMMSTETRYSPTSYAKYAYGYLTSLLGFILLVIGMIFMIDLKEN